MEKAYFINASTVNIKEGEISQVTNARREGRKLRFHAKVEVDLDHPSNLVIVPFGRDIRPRRRSKVLWQEPNGQLVETVHRYRVWNSMPKRLGMTRSAEEMQKQLAEMVEKLFVMGVGNEK
jgi:hypothetical protein